MADPPTSSDSTHFGYQTVPAAEKATLVGRVFTSVAGNYDVMNDLMSFGVHRFWKRFAAGKSGVRKGHRVLDVAGGSGDMTALLAPRAGPGGRVVMTDINAAMLAQGQDRLADRGLLGIIDFVQADAENLAFPDHTFDCVSIAFGLRNVTHIDQALASMGRVLKPGGRLLVLEFSRPRDALLAKAYDAYSFGVIPRLGEWIAHDRDSYQYLVESIRRHPDQEALQDMMLENGFDDVQVYNLAGGIVALHVGFKY